MTEQEWYNCNNFMRMAESLPMDGQERKAQLFTYACCRRIDSILHEEETQAALELALRNADGQASRDEVEEMVGRLQQFLQSHVCKDNVTTAQFYAGLAVFHALAGPFTGMGTALVAERVSWARYYLSGRSDADFIAEKHEQCQLLREIFGYPFRPVTIDRRCLSWNNGMISQLAWEIYDHDSFERLPVLADALEEAGCHQLDLLEHLRSPMDHVRGCWSLETILAQEADEYEEHRSVG